MADPTSRRGFLRTLAATGTGMTALHLASPTTLHARDPISRTGGHRFKFSLAAYSYRDLLKSGKLTLTDFIDDCAKMNLDGTELTSYYFPTEPSDDLLRKMKYESFSRGLDVSGTAVGNDFCHPPGAKRDEQILYVKNWIRYADKMDAPVIRIFSGRPRDGQSQNEARRLAVEAIEECCHLAGQHGVFLALENHGGLTASVDGMLEIIRDVKSPWFGVNLDSGNFHSANVYADLAKIAPYTLNVQVKVSIRPANGKKQPSDFGMLAKILRDSGYRGYIVLEYEESADPREECPRFVDKLREAFA